MASLLTRLLSRAGATDLRLARGEQKIDLYPKVFAKLVFSWDTRGIWIEESEPLATSHRSAAFLFSVPWDLIEQDGGVTGHDVWLVRHGYHDLDVSKLSRKLQTAVLERMVLEKKPECTLFAGHAVPVEFMPAVSSLEELQMHLDLADGGRSK